MDNPPTFVLSPLDAFRHQEGAKEYWLAREISKALGYRKWENLERVISKAKLICEQNRQQVWLHFAQTTRIRAVGDNGGTEEISDYILSRYALYLIVLISDMKKPEILQILSHFLLSYLEKDIACYAPEESSHDPPHSSFFITKEQTTIRQIQRAFKHVNSIQQYRVPPYFIDLYFPFYKIAIECDEHGHKRYPLEAEREREQFIKQQLRCTFVRYNPDAPGFNIGDVIHQIIKLIYHQHSKAVNGRVS